MALFIGIILNESSISRRDEARFVCKNLSDTTNFKFRPFEIIVSLFHNIYISKYWKSSFSIVLRVYQFPLFSSTKSKPTGERKGREHVSSFSLVLPQYLLPLKQRKVYVAPCHTLRLRNRVFFFSGRARWRTVDEAGLHSYKFHSQGDFTISWEIRAPIAGEEKE